ncbi:choice-of-anchor Q domain-containing protein [Candidatus Uabimicrobium sp. HlEnr_7]|uniref:choice-of-anchor Q domain-containing protein n=1 Tax=Candidatus Uabimicrobium helgolandensis TaxID=3095367 RepID=UPI0035563CB7
MNYKKLFILGFVFLLVHTLQARTIFVVSGDDSGRGTLRDAVENLEDGDVIRFQVNQVKLQSRIEFNFDNNDLNFDIIGPVTLNGDKRTSIFDFVDAGTVLVRDIRFINGFRNEGGGGAISAESGNKNITFENCEFTNNVTVFAGGAMNLENNTYTIRNCEFKNNTASISGGAINTEGGDFTLEDSEFINNEVLGDFLGVEDNNVLVPGDGGAFRDDDGGTSTFRNCLFQNNEADNNGGAIGFNNNGTYTITECEFIKNKANNGRGGAIFNAGEITELSICLFDDNSAEVEGGAIFNDNGDQDDNGDGELILVEDCTFEDNTCETGDGGAIRNNSVFTEMNRCLFDGNRANDGQGGAIFASENIDDIRNTTFSKNFSSGGGGAVFAAADIAFDSCTVVLNNGTLFTGGIVAFGDNVISLVNTIVALNNPKANIPDVFGNFDTGNNNLIGDNSGSNFVDGEDGNQVGNANDRLNPQIKALKDNGGFTKTHELKNNSPAINTGDTDLDDDGRSFARPAGGTDDIGALELGATPSLRADQIVQENAIKPEQLKGRCDAKISYDGNAVNLEWSNHQKDKTIVGFNVFKRLQKNQPQCFQVSKLLIMVKPGSKVVYTFSDTNILPKFRYFYRLQYITNDGKKYFSPPIKIITSVQD